MGAETWTFDPRVVTILSSHRRGFRRAHNTPPIVPVHSFTHAVQQRELLSMSDAFLPFCRPQISADDIEAVAAVLRSGWITTGPQCAALESAFCEQVGARFAVSAISATAQLHLYLVVLGIGPGDEVITPSLTWVSTPNVI